MTSDHAMAMSAGPDVSFCPLMPTYAAPTVQFVRGEGSWLYDVHGDRYLDLLSGLAVTSLGHSHPEVAAAIAAQASTLLHVSNLYGNEHQGPLAASIDERMRRYRRPTASSSACLAVRLIDAVATRSASLSDTHSRSSVPATFSRAMPSAFATATHSVMISRASRR